VKNPKGTRQILPDMPSRRLRVVITDEKTGEHVATASGVETLALLVAPDTLRGEEYRRIILGDIELVQALLLDTLKDVTEWTGKGAVLDLTDLLFDELLADDLLFDEGPVD